MKRILALFVFCIMIFSLVGCGDTDGGQTPSLPSSDTSSVAPDASGSDTTASTDTETAAFTVNGVDISKFSIVRPHYNTSYLVQVEMEALVETVKNEKKGTVEILEDAYTAQGQYEIIVGKTNRDGVELIEEHDAFNITVSGDKVYLNRGNTYSTAMAVSEFAKMLQNGVTDRSTVKNASYKATYLKSYDPTVDYRPVWVDDFDGTKVDTTKWDVIDEEYGQKDHKTGTSGKNGLRAWRRPENIKIYDGFFHAECTRDFDNYYGGTIRTNKHMTFMYGYVETSCLLPQGRGFWNTLYMAAFEPAELVYPEIDVNESFGNSALAEANAHVHISKQAAELGYTHRSFDTLRANESRFRLPDGDPGSLKDAFHTYGFLWTEDYIAFTGDGKIYCDLNLNEEGFEDYKAAFTTVPVKMILSCVAGCSACPLPQTATDEEWATSNVYVSDYVHLYQLDDGGRSVLNAENKVEW